jgi:non-specific serine/threonine protein kinase
VAPLCRRLDGIPLGIELAVVWLRSLSVEELVAGLDDRLGVLTGARRMIRPRHGTMRAAVAWSYDLCSAVERLLWARRRCSPAAST